MQFESEADAQLCECSLPRARSSSVSSRDNYGVGRVWFDNYRKVCSAIDIRDYVTGIGFTRPMSVMSFSKTFVDL